jgi:8-amino-7-oxononanoate synthase
VADSVFSALQEELSQRAAAGLKRTRRLVDSPQGPRINVDGRELLSFCSNDYMGLANNPRIIEALADGARIIGAGSGASHLITGHHRLHDELEQALADFVGRPAALFFSTGYMANIAAICSLVGRKDAVFADKLNHASLNDGMVLSRAEMYRYTHNDVQELEKLLKASQASRKLVVTDAVFSMDGDIAPLKQILALCEQYDAWLLVDDAHGFGVLGESGSGILSHLGLDSPRIIYMGTLGKAAGVSGAFIAGEKVLIEYLIQNARTYIYTTAMPAALASALLESLKIIGQADDKRQHLDTLISTFKTEIRLRKWKLAESPSAIQPVIVGSNETVVRLSEYLLERGMLVPAIRPPTVPKGSARLRISFSAAHQQSDVMQLVNALHQAEERFSA